jgi:hypothetical protein
LVIFRSIVDQQYRLPLLTSHTKAPQTVRKLFNWGHTIDFGPSPIEIERLLVEFWPICASNWYGSSVRRQPICSYSSLTPVKDQEYLCIYCVIGCFDHFAPSCGQIGLVLIINGLVYENIFNCGRKQVWLHRTEKLQRNPLEIAVSSHTHPVQTTGLMHWFLGLDHCLHPLYHHHGW